MESANLALQIAEAVQQQTDLKIKPYFLFEDRLGEGKRSNPKVADQQYSQLIRAALGLGSCQEGVGVSREAAPTMADYLLPGLAVYCCQAVSGEMEPGILAAVAWEFLIRASYIFDDLQDQDKASSLPAQYGNRMALDVALILLQAGQALELEVLNSIFDKPCREVTRDKAEIMPQLSVGLTRKLFQTIALAARGQLLDLQEISIPALSLFEEVDYSLKKAGLKSALILSHITELGATIGVRLLQNKQVSNIALYSTNYWENLIECYRQFGFNFGIVLNIANDLKDFLSGLLSPANVSRDLKQRNITLPYVYAFQSLASNTDRNRFLELWQQREVSNSGSSQEIVELVRDAARLVTAQTVSTALIYLSQAQVALRKIDPELENLQHKLMLNLLQNMVKAFSASSSRVAL